ncbi:MAG: hypothetical protein O3A10_06065 [Chloroflexi bacterium]|nr:hypothetical protein [Chloroflexota bacterium]MDA1145648.1 hypothetical protein [Chloroflexota bacterium]
MTKGRLGGIAAVALVAALAMALILTTRADAQQAITSSVSVSPTNATNQIGSSYAVGVTVSPAQSGVRVRYQVLSGPNAGGSGALDTNSNGLAIFSYNGTGGVGTDAILVWADLDRDGVRDSTEPVSAAIVQWVGVAGTGIQLSPSSSSGTQGSGHTLTATLSPAQGGVLVRFQIPSGPNVGTSGIAITSASGQATFTYSGNGGLGTDSITAWPDFHSDGIRDGNEAQATATRVWTTGSTSGVVVAPSTAQRAVGGQHTVNATLAPAQSGLYMRFEVTSGPNAGARGVALTDGGGRGTYTYLGRGGDGVDVIVAWADLNQNLLLDSNEPRGQATANWGTATPSQTIIVSPGTASNRVGTVHTVTSTASPAKSGLVVRFRITAGPHIGAVSRVLTNTAGQATFSYWGTTTGTDAIATWIDADDDGVLDSGEARATAAKTWTSTVPVKSIVLAPLDNVSLVGTTHTVTATVGPLQSGAIVRFFVSAGPNKGDAGVGVTNSLGRATFAYLGDGGVGSDAVMAWLDVNNNGVRDTNEPQATAAQRWASTQASGISATPTSSSGAVNTQHTVTATVSPTVNGVLVRFRVNQGPNLGREGIALTNSSGQATFAYLGSGGVGSDLVLVWADTDGDGVIDANEPQTAVIRGWTAVAASSFALTPANDTNPVNTRHSMTATVVPAQSGLLVRF